MPKRPWKAKHSPNPKGNPNFMDPDYAPRKAAQFSKENPSPHAFLPGHTSLSSGSAPAESNKSIRKALMRLMNENPDDRKVSRCKADEIARRLYDLSRSDDPKVALAAIEQLANRVDGRPQPSKEETDAIAAGGATVVLIDSRMLPPINPPFIDTDEPAQLLENADTQESF